MQDLHPNTMDLAQLETFVVIAHMGSFSRAADRLHRSQPAISRRLAMLEDALGAPVFERIGKRVQLTDVGRALLPHAESALAAAASGRAAVRAQLGDGGGSVALGIVGTLVDGELAAQLTRFRDAGPLGRLRITTASSVVLSTLTRLGEVTLAVRYFVDRNAEVVCKTIGRERMVVVAAQEPKRAVRRAVKPADVHWVGFTSSKLMPEDFGRLLAAQLERAGVTSPNITYVDSLSAQKRLVEAGFGVAFLPRSSVRQELREGVLRELPMRNIETEIPIALVHRRGGYLSPAARELMSLLSATWPA